MKRPERMTVMRPSPRDLRKLLAHIQWCLQGHFCPMCKSVMLVNAAPDNEWAYCTNPRCGRSVDFAVVRSWVPMLQWHIEHR